MQRNVVPVQEARITHCGEGELLLRRLLIQHRLKLLAMQLCQGFFGAASELGEHPDRCGRPSAPPSERSCSRSTGATRRSGRRRPSAFVGPHGPPPSGSCSPASRASRWGPPSRALCVAAITGHTHCRPDHKAFASGPAAWLQCPCKTLERRGRMGISIISGHHSIIGCAGRHAMAEGGGQAGGRAGVRGARQSRPCRCLCRIHQVRGSGQSPHTSL